VCVKLIISKITASIVLGFFRCWNTITLQGMA